MEIAVIGTDDFVTGFQLAGVWRTYAVADHSQLEEKMELALNDSAVGILVLEEEQIEKLSNKSKKRLDKLVTPVIVTLSSKGKETDLRELIKRTVGVDLWK
jgi:V/A-type H+-transporting ATPase subunit F